MANPLNSNSLEFLLCDLWKKKPYSFWRNGTINYYERFTRIADYLNKEIHPHTLAGALASQLAKINEAVKAGTSEDELSRIIIKNSAWLTDHGPAHIQTVIQRASNLIGASECELSPYEIYILLAAIHFHDVGNIFGRQGHEKRISEVMAQMDKSVLGDDDFEKRLIRSIAAAHGGSYNGDEDTIRYLQYAPLIKAPRIRPHLLAAILRFADELSEDSTRVSRFPIDNNLILQASQVYHHYARSLKQVNIEDGNVDIHFELSKDVASKKYGKGDQKVFLLDEIFNRTLKIHCEHIYCMRYMRQEININSVTVSIGIYSNDYLDELCHYDYKMEERGYPPKPAGGIHDICDSLKDINGTKLTGELLSQKLETL